MRELATPPKAHPHVHLEGAVRRATLADLARAGVDASFAPPEVRAQLHRAVDGWLAGGIAAPAAGG